MIILLMGVTGAGKTTVGKALAAELHWKFADADEFHSPANVEKMHAGIPLTDADRAPWLTALHDAIAGRIASGESVVLACSALKQSYRALLLIGPEVKLVYLRASPDLIARRLAGRRHQHFMNPSLIQSQFDTLQEPPDAVIVDTNQPVSGIVAAIRTALAI